MIPNCRCCEEEYSEACYQVSLGYHIATSLDREFINAKGHLCITIVDDNGKIIIW